jgi:signal transduction histidine kinase
MNMDQLDGNPKAFVIEPTASLLVTWIRWYGWAVFAVGCFFFVVFAFRQSPASLVFAIGLTLFAFPTLRHGLSAARRGSHIRALVCVTAVSWIFALIGAARGSTALPAIFPLLLLPVILSLPYASSQGLLKTAIGSLLVCAVAIGLTLFGSILPSSLQEATLALVILPIVLLTTGLALFGLWHVGSRLRKSLFETETMNRALADSERSLEAKVRARTAELRGALEEISDIQEIGNIVNATLDFDLVVSTIKTALQRVFQFDTLSVFLLDTERQLLEIDRVVGIELDPETKRQFRGIPMSEESSLLVSAVRERKARWASDLGPDSVAMMSPGDRVLYEIDPSKSLLICPLKIKGTAIGVIAFTNKSESVVLSEEEIDRIQRYVTPLSTMIRNARLFEAAQCARAEAVESSQAKSQFLANMSHELRTPLNAILGYSEMLQEEAAENSHDEYVPDLERIHASGHFLLALINGVLDLTKIEAGKMEVTLEQFCLADLLTEVASTAGPLAQKNGNLLELGDFSSLGQMHSDPTKIRQIILNLLSNSSKFTNQGSISLSAQRESNGDEDWLVVRVVDSGIGMAADQLEQVFAAFAQADNSTSRKYGGTGLGLTITREFCEMLSGTIEVESELEAGTTFTVRLPMNVRSLEKQTTN